MKPYAFILSLACVVVILAGLKAAASVIVPFLLAIFIAVIVSPAVLYIQKLGFGRIFSFLIVSVCVFAVLAFFGDIVFKAISGFSSQLPEFYTKFRVILDEFINKLNSYGFIQIDSEFMGIDQSVVVNKTTALLKATSSFVSMSIFIFILVAFILFETSVIEEKVEYFARHNPNAGHFARNFIFNLKKYLLIKSVSSLVTGLLIGFGLFILGVPYAALWGILAFILNYIPTFGSIAAAIPTLFITIVTMDATTAVWVLGIYLFINITIGNIIEPRFMGEGLGISTIIVLASLLLWGFVFGLGGLFLAVPLTMSIQIALMSNSKTKFLAIILSNKVDKDDKIQ